MLAYKIVRELSDGRLVSLFEGASQRTYAIGLKTTHEDEGPLGAYASIETTLRQVDWKHCQREKKEKQARNAPFLYSTYRCFLAEVEIDDRRGPTTCLFWKYDPYEDIQGKVLYGDGGGIPTLFCKSITLLEEISCD